ncbi:Enamine/imine deaminase [Rosistilla oblonga]|uniref:Enamine/imine deaminase n=2 Tax=Rosistilla TaxID=2795779 RepID=A0A518IW57_9BACT|nr:MULTISPECIES: RidA family protein [Rosistilla]QDV14550.1 Enamine/imine deaminase [Rosistilla oblonga]QDV57316.1 Enamine/imine deaminase [Rosistilla oblonga]QDV70847.1 Enamine/imine deaminase [Rosistilla carotiformis]
MSAEANLEKLNLELPPAPKPAGVYKPCVIVGNMAYLSGHGPLKPDGNLIVGRLGEDMDLEAGYAAARQVGLTLLASIKANLGSLDRVKRVVKALALVRCTDAFDQQPAVVNGFSELFREVFGEEFGVGARSAMGTNALPGGIAVEIEVILEIEA